MLYYRNYIYWFSFMFLFFVTGFSLFSIGQQIHLWSSFFASIIVVIIAALVALPIISYLSDKFMRFSIDRSFHKTVIIKFVLAFMIALPITLVSYSFYNEYKVKNLNDALGFTPSQVITLEIEADSDQHIFVKNNKVAADELFEFLGQYKIKKMNEDDWVSDVSKESGFNLTVHTKGSIIGATIYEKRLIIYNNGSYYSVTNGPVNTEWVVNFMNKYQ